MSPTFTRSSLIAVAAAAILFGAGCSTTVSGTPAPVSGSLPAGSTGSTDSAGASATSDAPASGSTDAVTWMNGFCGSLKPFVSLSSSPPKIDSSGSPATAVKSLSVYLGKAVSGIDNAISGLAALGPSPAAGGDEAVTKLTAALKKFRGIFQTAKTKLDAVDTSDIAALATALPDAVAPLQELQNFPNPLGDLQSSAELDAAAATAPNCKSLIGN